MVSIAVPAAHGLLEELELHFVFIFGEYLLVADASCVYCKNYHHLTLEPIRQTRFLFRLSPFPHFVPVRLAVEIGPCLVYGDHMLQADFLLIKVIQIARGIHAFTTLP